MRLWCHDADFFELFFSLKYFPDLQQESLPVESSGPEETVCVDKKAVDKLTEGLLSHYLPDLQNSKRALQELTWVFHCFVLHHTQRLNLMVISKVTTS